MADGYNFVHRQSAEFFIENPIHWTYADLKKLIVILKETVAERLSKEAWIGTIIDAGAEFVESDFKFKDHPEVMKNGKDLGLNDIFGSFVDCTARLKPDHYSYAAFPHGIPDGGVSFGEFLGSQIKSLSEAVGFDYVWFSNGLGFGFTPWESKGELFDEETFHYDKFAEINKQTLQFWKDFKLHSANMPIGVRGTNNSVGFDLSVFGVSMKDVYDTAPILISPPNPPWGSVNPGLEMTVYMSRIAKTATKQYGMRFYYNDTWFHSEPWYGYYAEEGFDILMPFKVTRINEMGQVESPKDINIFSLDDDKGGMDESQALEVTSYFNKALRRLPDQPGIVTWVYPFDELDKLAKETPEHLHQVYFHDMYIRDIINQGFPLNTVISSENFIKLVHAQSTALDETILLIAAPREGTDLSECILKWLQLGKKIILYGSLKGCDPQLLDSLGVSLEDGIAGNLTLTTTEGIHSFKDGYGSGFQHLALTSGGDIQEILVDPTRSQAIFKVSDASHERLYALVSNQPERNFAWIRGSVGLIKNVLHTDFAEAHLIHALLPHFEFKINNVFALPDRRSIVNLISRKDGAYYVTGHKPDDSTYAQYEFPKGAPLFLHTEALIENGKATYFLTKTFDYEVRFFVKQNKKAVIRCKEDQITSYKYKRAISIHSLEDARLYFLPPNNCADQMANLVFRNLTSGELLDWTFDGKGYVVENLTGNIEVMW